MTLATLNGLYRPDFVAGERLHFPVGSAPDAVKLDGREIEIRDARALQDSEGLTVAEFFACHSFVLLRHVTAVRDWDCDVESLYLPEIESVVRERLLPGRRIEVRQSPSVLRRGRGTLVPFYAEGVHSDGGADEDDFARNIEAFAGDAAAASWRRGYAREEVLGVVWIDFWRPTNMASPLEHMPLALCDASSLDPADLVPTAMTGIAPDGGVTHHLGLRTNPGQRWFYYPRMTGEEMLAFKLAEFWKTPGAPRNCFHSAFHHPDTPAGAQPRQSCEHRVSVTVLRD